MRVVVGSLTRRRCQPLFGTPRTSTSANKTATVPFLVLINANMLDKLPRFISAFFYFVVFGSALVITAIVGRFLNNVSGSNAHVTFEVTAVRTATLTC